MKKSFLLLLTLLGFLGCQTLTEVDNKAPEIIFTQDKYAISPNNDNIQDYAVISFNIKDSGFIRYWKFEIFSKDGKAVKSYQSETNLEEEQKRTFPVKKSVGIPANIVWYGEDIENKKLPDGEYFFTLTAMNEKKLITPKDKYRGAIIIDTDKPEIKIVTDGKIFSPNSDGNKDLLKIDIDIIKNKVEPLTAKEIKDFIQKWYVEILDPAGKVVKKFEFSEKGKKEILWDGKDESGNIVADGNYKIKTYSKDIGGNYFEDTITDIIKDSTVSIVELKIDENVFSPNNDKIKDTINFKFNVPVKENILNWGFSIINTANNQVIRTLNGDASIIESFVWDGKDNGGKLQPDGIYKAKIFVEYANGNKPIGESELIVLDNTAPSATVKLGSNIFSPDGNGKQDELEINQTSSKEDTKWTGKIYNLGNNLVKTFSWDRETPRQTLWDGKDNEGKLLPDGRYYYQLSTVDLAGNSYLSQKYFTQIYTKDTPLFITAAYPSFSPNGDNVFDKQVFELKMNMSKENTVTSWKINIENEKGEVVYSVDNKGDLPESAEWDGKGKDKKAVADGLYKAVLNVVFKAGTESKTVTKYFLVDNTPPSVEIKKSLKHFTPDNDGDEDKLDIELLLDDKSGIGNWVLKIFNPAKTKEIFSFSGDDAPKDKLTWDGRNKDGILVVESAEDYPVVVVVEDKVGNITEKSVQALSVGILVEKLPDGRYKIRISNIRFKADSPQMEDVPKNKEILDLLGYALKKFPKNKIKLEGYANKYSERLNERVAKKLSEERCETVAKELNKRGILENRISVEGKGFDNPIIPFRPGMTKDEIEELARNRRVEFYLEKE